MVISLRRHHLMRASRRHAPIYQTNPCNSTDRSGHTQTRARSPICHHVPVSIRIVCHSPALHPLFIWPPPSLPVVSLCQPCHCVWQLLILTSDLIWALISYVHTSPRASPCVTSPELDEMAVRVFLLCSRNTEVIVSLRRHQPVCYAL